MHMSGSGVTLNSDVPQFFHQNVGIQSSPGIQSRNCFREGSNGRRREVCSLFQMFVFPMGVWDYFDSNSSFGLIFEAKVLAHLSRRLRGSL